MLNKEENINVDFQLSIKDYMDFLHDEVDLIYTITNKKYHSLSYQMYCYDLLLGNKVIIDNYTFLFSFLKKIHKKKDNENEEEKESHWNNINDMFRNNDLEFWEMLLPKYKKIFLDYFSKIEVDTSFKQLVLEFLKGYIGIIIISQNKKLDDFQYIKWVKLINSSFENWIIEWRDITIEFNLIVRNTYKTLDRDFLKIH